MVKRTVAILQEFSLPLIGGVLFAVLWANISPASYDYVVHHEFVDHAHWSSLHFFFNDIFMAVFFGIAAKEITEACLPGGSLNPPQKAINPLFATAGGVVGPVAAYFAFVAITGDQTIANGWGIPTATDIALAWLIARIAFGKGHPAITFLLLLAVADDGVGLGIIAVFYPDPAHPVEPAWLGLVGFAMLAAYGLRRANVQNFWPYLMTAGVLAWSGLYLAHLHPALALVPVVPFMPNRGKDEGMYAETPGHHDDTLNRFEHTFKLPVDFGLFGFGLMNAGVAFSSVGNATWAVLVALLVGKTFGIFGFSMLAHQLGFKLPEGMDWRSLLCAGLTAALGLTVALFVAGVAFTDGELQGAAKMGALLSVVAAPMVIALARFLRAHEIAPAEKAQARERDPNRGPSNFPPEEYAAL